MLRLREDMRPIHKTHRKGWWCRAFATAINRQYPTCNDHRTVPPFTRTIMRPDMFKNESKKETVTIQLQDNEVGLIFRLALPEELEWDTLAEDVALSLEAIKRCLSNMLVALDRDTPKQNRGLHLRSTFQCRS